MSSRARPWLAEHAWLVALALLVPLAAGSIALVERFDGLYGQDSYTYLDYATGPLRDSLVHLNLPPPFFWPPGYPYFVALASFAVGRVALAGQLVSLVAAASIPVSTALIAQELWPGAEARAGLAGRRWPPLAPLVAGLLVAFAGQLWQSSVVVMSDTLALAAATGGVAALARYGRRGELRWLLLFAGLMAGAIATRWVYGVVAVPCAVYALVVALRRRGRTPFLHATTAVAVALAVLSPVLVRALRGGPGAFSGSFEIHSWSPARIFEREFVTSDGIISYPLPTGLYYALVPAHWAFFTPLLAPLVLVGIWLVVRRRTAARLLLLLGWAGAIYLFQAGAAYQGLRFGLAYLPPLAILAGIGAAWVAGRLSTHRLATVAGAAVLALGLAGMAAGGAHFTEDLIARKNDGLAVMHWTEATVPSRARLLTFTLTLTFEHYSRLETIELFEQTPRRLRQLVESRKPLFVLVDVRNVLAQWRDGPPGRNLRWLERKAGLTRIGARSGFTLFRVGRF
jgi:hypothetical protein